jgi:hypothetical protein
LKKFIDKKDDLLVTYILAKLFLDQKDKFYKNCEDALFESLNKLKMFTQRILLSHKLNEIHMSILSKTNSNNQNLIKKFNQIDTIEFSIYCFYCNLKIQSDKSDQFRSLNANNTESFGIVNLILIFLFYSLI